MVFHSSHRDASFIAVTCFQTRIQVSLDVSDVFGDYFMYRNLNRLELKLQEICSSHPTESYVCLTLDYVPK